MRLTWRSRSSSASSIYSATRFLISVFRRACTVIHRRGGRLQDPVSFARRWPPAAGDPRLVEKRRAGALLSRRARRDTPTRPIAWISHLSLIDRFIRLDYLLITICIDPDGLCTSDQAMRRTELSRLESPAHAVTPMAGTHTHTTEVRGKISGTATYWVNKIFPGARSPATSRRSRVDAIFFSCHVSQASS